LSLRLHRENLENVNTLLVRNDINALILDDPINLFYFTGFETSVPKGVFAVVARNDEPFIVMQELEAVLFRETGAFEKVILRGHKDPVGDLLHALSKNGIRDKIGVDLSRISASFYKRLKTVDALHPVDIGNELLGLRYTKRESELSRIRRACAIATKAMETAISVVRADKTELEIAAEAIRTIMGEGAEPAFIPTIQTGRRGSLPNALSSATKIKTGDLVVIDLGVKYQGYCSDICRTTVCGPASRTQKDLLLLVKKAQEAAIKKIKPKASAASIDAAARAVIEHAGYGPKFIHRAGHGIGCEVHEKPFLGKDHPEQLEPGVVMSVEPGVYDPSFGGVRIEDNILVTNTGFEVLTANLAWNVGIMC